MIRDGIWKAGALRAFVLAAVGITLASEAGAVQSAGKSMAATAVEPASVEVLEELAEVWVHGKRLSDDIETAEDDFFRLFNKKNRNALYDIHCGTMSLYHGSMIMRRTCVPGYITVYSTPAYSYAPTPLFFGGIVCSGGCDTWSGSYYSYIPPPPMPSPPVGLLNMQYSEKFIDNLLNVINGDPQLLQRAWHIEGLYHEMLQVQLRYADIDVDPKTREKVVRKLGRSRAAVRVR